MSDHQTEGGMLVPDERISLCPDHVGYFDDYRVWVIEDGERHWCVEMLPEEALKSHGVDSLGYETVDEYLDDMGPVTCETVWWSKQITVTFECDREGKSVGVVKHTRMARDWAVDYRGVFCSTTW